MPHTNGSRPPFKAGDLLFFSGRDWLAWGIKHGTRPWLGWSHVGLVVHFEPIAKSRWNYTAGPGRAFLVDATTRDKEPCLYTGKTSGCRARSIPERIKAYQDDGGQVYHFPVKCQLSADWQRDLEHHACDQLGKDYDWLGAWRCRTTPIAKLMRWRYPNTEKMLYCAECAGLILRDTGVIRCRKPGDLSPNSLAELVTAQGTHGPAWRCE